jgi:hypothetical protein
VITTPTVTEIQQRAGHRPRLAAYCLPDRAALGRNKQTRDLDHILSATFGLWEFVLPASKRFKPR